MFYNTETLNSLLFFPFSEKMADFRKGFWGNKKLGNLKQKHLFKNQKELGKKLTQDRATATKKIV
jgi:hypothetical protein